MIFDIHEIFEDAAERAGIELRTGYDFKTARRSLALLLREWANRGYNLYSIDEGEIELVKGVAEYELPRNTIDVTDAAIRTDTGTLQQFDQTMGRITLVDYYNTPSKLQEGMPTQFYVKRTACPMLVVWQTPNKPYLLVYWRMKMMNEPESGVQQVGVPDRWTPAIIAGLALQIAMKRPAVADRVPGLAQEYDKQLQLAQDEDRDRSAFFVTPWVRGCNS